MPVRWQGDGCISCFDKGFWVTGALADPNAVVPQGEWSVQELKDEGCLMVHNAGVTSLSIEMGETLAYGLSEEDEFAGSALQVEADPGMDVDETDELSPGSWVECYDETTLNVIVEEYASKVKNGCKLRLGPDCFSDFLSLIHI